MFQKNNELKNKYHPQISILVIKISNCETLFFVHLLKKKMREKWIENALVSVEKANKKVNLNVTIAHDFP